MTYQAGFNMNRLSVGLHGNFQLNSFELIDPLIKFVRWWVQGDDCKFDVRVSKVYQLQCLAVLFQGRALSGYLYIGLSDQLPGDYLG